MKKIRTYTEKIIRAIAMLALALIVSFPITVKTPTFVKADYIERANEFDETYVEDDLGEAKLLEYSLMVGTEPSIVSFMEYCYSSDESLLNAKYGLYLYVLNPTRKEYVSNVGGNQINMAISHDSEGNPTSYKILKLKNCGHTTGEYDKLVYKFRVLGLEDVVKDVTAQNKSQSYRKYSVAGLQLRTVGSGAITDYAVSRSFKFTGYAKGCGAGAEKASTLACTIGEATTIELEVGHTNYRTEDFGDYDYICDEVNTVYFSVPNEYFEEYGEKLQKIKAQWYEYKTKPVFVTSDSDADDSEKGFPSYIGKYIGEGTDDLKWQILWEDSLPDDGAMHRFNAAYNAGTSATSESILGGFFSLSPDYKVVPQMDWFFYRKNATNRDNYCVPAEEVEEYIIWYTNKFPDRPTYSIPTAENGQLREVATDLFEDSIDADRIELLEDKSKNNGYICQEIDAGEEQSLTVEKSQKKWDKFWGGTKFEEKGYSPIVQLTSSINSLTLSQFEQQYYVNDSDGKIFTFCKNALNNGETPILFRFANTEYYACNARFDYCGGAWGDGSSLSSIDGYVAQETVFLGFDMISLTFRKDMVDTVIGVVSNPIDIINGFTPPTDLPVPKPKGPSCADSAKRVFSIVVLAMGLTLAIKLLIAFFNMIGSFGGGKKK